jgi:lipopolysaccharide export LptBFGC system permease protein LptF
MARRQRSTVHPQRVEASGSSCLATQTEKKTIMPLLNILLALIVVGFLLWLVNRFIPMAGSIKSILNGVVVIGVVLWLLNVFGIFHSLSRIRVG